MNMTIATEKLLAAIIDDYAKYQDRSNVSDTVRETQLRMREDFVKSLYCKEGKKYIKVIKDNSVWGFIVNTKDDVKFQYGDILKAVSWATPAKNSARGNIFEEYTVQWTGPLYLR